MHLYLVAKMKELRLDDYQFFEVAHVALFGTLPDLSNCVVQYRLHGIIPKYVERYLKQLQEDELNT